MVLGRDGILGADDLTTDDVEVPEWGGVVRIKMLTANQKDSWEASVFDKNGNRTPTSLTGLRARLAALSIVDHHGVRVFTDKDVPRLGQKSSAALERVFDAARKLNGINEEDVAELAEDFGGDQDEPESSESPSPLA